MQQAFQSIPFVLRPTISCSGVNPLTEYRTREDALQRIAKSLKLPVEQLNIVIYRDREAVKVVEGKVAFYYPLHVYL